MNSALSQSNNDFIPNATTSKRKRIIKKRKIKEQPEFIVAYEKYLLMMNYSITTIKPHLSRTKTFQQFFSELNNIKIERPGDFKSLKLTDIVTYENHLINRVIQKEIKDETAYSYIKNIRLFLQFLNHNKIIGFLYTIPKKFITEPTRLNTYIDQQLISDLIIAAYSDRSETGIKTLAILLLLVDTGCRLIELSNLRINDLSLSERKITLHSVKSDKRTLILSDLVIMSLKEYTKLRNALSTKNNYLFLNESGNQIPLEQMSNMIYSLNINVFGKSLINARAIRHTFITNAIDNNNELENIAATVGHKHWESTLYYLYRSDKRLLANTLKFDPLKNILEEY